MRVMRASGVFRVVQIFVVALALSWTASHGYANTKTPQDEARSNLRTGEEALRSLDYNRALSALNKALSNDALEPRERAVALLNRGLARQNLREFEASISDYSSALEIGTLPTAAKAIAYFNRGLAHNSTGQTTLALDDLTTAINTNSAFAQAYNSRATLMRMLGRHQSAIRDYQAAVKYRYPQPHLAFYGEALSYLELRQRNLARIALTNALSANPNFALAKTKLAELNKAVRAETTVVEPASSTDATAVVAGTRSEAGAGPGPQNIAPAVRNIDSDADATAVPPKPSVEAAPTRVASLPPAPPAVEEPKPKYEGYLVQLMAQRNPAALKSAWNKMTRKHAGVLRDYSPIIEEADLGTRGIVFRLKTGPFETRKGADRLCRSLKKRGQACFSVKVK